MADFLMPSLGADMEAATLIKWLVAPGDRVKRGDIVAEVDTEKGIIEIECFENGMVDKLVAQPGMKLPVGALMAVIRGGGAPAAVEKRGVPEPPMPSVAPTSVHVSTTTKEQPAETRPKASPLARKLAAELGIDLSSVVGTGAGGVIDREDVERAAAKRGAPAPAAKLEAAAEAPASGMRRAIAAAMARSKREIPHYYLQTDIDMSRALAWLESENAKRSIAERLLPAALFVKATAKALCEVPELNGFWIDGQHRIADTIHVGFAIVMKSGGLVAPAIHDADKKNLDELMAALRDLIPRARAGRLRSSEMTDATITLTSLGDLGVQTVFGVIYPPQVAIVGLGKVLQKPWAQEGMLGVHPVMTATLSGDHRATDGHRGAQFLKALNRALQAPEKLGS